MFRKPSPPPPRPRVVRWILALVALAVIAVASTLWIVVAAGDGLPLNVRVLSIDLGDSVSPRGTNHVRVFAIRGGALGWDTIWIFWRADDTHDYRTLLVGDVYTTNPLPITWTAENMMVVDLVDGTAKLSVPPSDEPTHNATR